jgi:hypothetical protein
MEDPVALSSGYIFDRSTVLDSKGNLRYDRCPISGKILDRTIIPLPSIKNEKLRYLEHREKTVKEIADKLFTKHHSFQLVLEVVEKYLEGQEDMFLPLVRELTSMWIQRDGGRRNYGDFRRAYSGEWSSSADRDRNNSMLSHGYDRGTRRQSTYSHHHAPSTTGPNSVSSKHDISTNNINNVNAPLPADMIPALRGKYKFIDDTNAEPMRNIKDERPTSRNMRRHSSFESANTFNSLDVSSSKRTGSLMSTKDRHQLQNSIHTGSRTNQLDFYKNGGDEPLEERDVNDVSTKIRYDHSHQNMMKLHPMILMVDNMTQSVVGGNSIVLVKSGPLYTSVNRIMISANEMFQESSSGGRSRLVLALYNDRGQLVTKKDVFDNYKGRKSRAFCEIGINSGDDDDDNDGHHEDIISMARPRYFYQLECQVAKGTQEKISFRGLICKIIPTSINATIQPGNRLVRMKDPEGESGRYMGPVDVVGHAHGKGIFDYENGCTFVGDFVHGKFFRGVYYRASQIHGTMKNGKWDEREIDRTLAKDFVYEVRIFSRELKLDRFSNGIVEQKVDESQDYSFLCCHR